MVFLSQQIAHTMNVQHDDSTYCIKRFSNSEYDGGFGGISLQVKMMYSSHFGLFGAQIPADEPWSDCSAHQLHYFLQQGHGKCLYDVPQKTYFNKNAGNVKVCFKIILALMQCKMIFFCNWKWSLEKKFKPMITIQFFSFFFQLNL